MVRAAALGLLLLAGCNRQSDTDRRSVYADVQSKAALEQLKDQRNKVFFLEQRLIVQQRELYRLRDDVRRLEKKISNPAN